MEFCKFSVSSSCWCFGIVFNCRPHFRSHIHSQCGLFFIKNIGFCIFQQCESKKRIACVIYLCSIVGIIFLFYYFVFMWTVHMGAYCVPLAPLFRGFGMGITAGYLYAAYGFQGFLFHLAVILPGAFICLIAILIASRESMLFSKRYILAGRRKSRKRSRKTMCGIFYSFFYFNRNINHRRFGRCTDHSLLFRLICILIER